MIYTQEYWQKKGVQKFINWWFDLEFYQQKIENKKKPIFIEREQKIPWNQSPV